jgi:hypothetical protein
MAFSPTTPKQKLTAFERMTREEMALKGYDPYNTADHWKAYKRFARQASDPYYINWDR